MPRTRHRGVPDGGLADSGTNSLVTYDRLSHASALQHAATTGSKSEYLQTSMLLGEDINQLVFILATLTACFGLKTALQMSPSSGVQGLFVQVRQPSCRGRETGECVTRSCAVQLSSMRKYADNRLRLGTQSRWEESSGFISSATLCSLNVLLVSVWVSPGPPASSHSPNTSTLG